MMESFSVWVIFMILSPIIGGLLVGIDGFISASMKGMGKASLLQPFIDFFKLIAKKTPTKNSAKIPYIAGHFIFSVAAIIFIGFKQDIFLVMLMIMMSWIFLILFGINSKNVFTKLSAKRLLFSILATFPSMLIYGISVYLLTGGSSIQDILYYPGNTILKLPFLFITMIMTIMIYQGKPPFDSVMTYDAGKVDMCGGLIGELGCKSFAVVNLTRWINIAALYAFIILFIARTLWMGILLGVCVLIAQIFFEAIFVKLRYQFIYWAVPLIMFLLSITNVVWLSIR